MRPYSFVRLPSADQLRAQAAGASGAGEQLGAGAHTEGPMQDLAPIVAYMRKAL